MNKLAQGCIAEFIGTFALCFAGCASIVLTVDSIGAGSLATVALAHGLVLTVFVTACLYISGSQFNPAVSVGVLLAGKQSLTQTIAFIISQLLAAASGVGMMTFLFSENETTAAALETARHGATLGSLSDPETGSIISVFGIEALMTFALMFVILAAVVDDRAHKIGGFCVGLTVATGILAFGPLTGASMNPARSFGPALYGHWDMHWVYWAGPITGSIVAALVYRFVWADAKKSD